MGLRGSSAVPENRGNGVHLLFLSPSCPASLLPDPPHPLSWALAPAESLSLDPSPWVAIPAGPHTLRCFRRSSTLCLAPHRCRSWTCPLSPVSAPCLPSPRACAYAAPAPWDALAAPSPPPPPSPSTPQPLRQHHQTAQPGVSLFPLFIHPAFPH